MKKLKKKKCNFYKTISSILLILSLICLIIMYYFNVLAYNYLLIFAVIISLLVIFLILKINKKNNNKFIYSISSILLIVFELLIIIYAIGTINFFNNIFDTGYRTDTYSIYVLDSKIDKIKDLNNKIIGYYKQDDNINKAFNKLKNKLKFEIKEYETINELINNLKSNNISAIFINDNILDIYNDNDNIKLNKLVTIDILIKNNLDFKTVDMTKKPFALYISGVDTIGKVNKSARSDVNIVAIINPLKEQILLINTPRDYYITLPSKNKKDKLTHAGIYGIAESAKALESLYEISINYYLRINFTSFISVIDDLGGITVDVQKPDYRFNGKKDCGIGYICEQNSKRLWEENTIYIKAGNNIKLNGEEALAYARNRHQYAGGDKDRGYHQSQIIKGIINNAKSSKMIVKYNAILKDLSKGIITNINQKDIVDFLNYNIKKKINWNIEIINAEGTDSYEKCYSLDNLKSFVLVPKDESLNSIKNKIKEIIN